MTARAAFKAGRLGSGWRASCDDQNSTEGSRQRQLGRRRSNPVDNSFLRGSSAVAPRTS